MGITLGGSTSMVIHWSPTSTKGAGPPRTLVTEECTDRVFWNQSVQGRALAIRRGGLECKLPSFGAGITHPRSG